MDPDDPAGQARREVDGQHRRRVVGRASSAAGRRGLVDDRPVPREVPLGADPLAGGRLGPRRVVLAVAPGQVVGPRPLLAVLLERDPDFLLLRHAAHLGIDRSRISPDDLRAGPPWRQAAPRDSCPGRRGLGSTIARCGVRRILKTLAIDGRNVVAAGDRVWFRPSGADEGLIEKVEGRSGTLTRGYRRKEHVIASNVDQLLIVSAFEEPGLKLPLIDRYLIAAEKGGIRPVIVLNKADLVDVAPYQWVVGLYTQLGYETLVTSAADGRGVARLRELLAPGGDGVLGAERRRQELPAERDPAGAEPPRQARSPAGPARGSTRRPRPN